MITCVHLSCHSSATVIHNDLPVCEYHYLQALSVEFDRLQLKLKQNEYRGENVVSSNLSN